MNLGDIKWAYNTILLGLSSETCWLQFLKMQRDESNFRRRRQIQTTALPKVSESLEKNRRCKKILQGTSWGVA